MCSLYWEFGKEQKKGKKKTFLTFRSGELNSRFSVIFLPKIWIFVESEGDKIKSKQPPKRDKHFLKKIEFNHGKNYPNLRPEKSPKLRELILYFCFEDGNKSKIPSEITPSLKPNLQEKPIWSGILNQFMRKKITSSTKRCDEYLIQVCCN